MECSIRERADCLFTLALAVSMPIPHTSKNVIHRTEIAIFGVNVGIRRLTQLGG